MLGRSLFLLQNRFLALVLPNLNHLDKILHTPIVVRNTLVGRLRSRSARGRLQAKPERLCFFSVIIVTHPKSYRDDGSPLFRRQTVKVEVEDGCYREKFQKFVPWAEPDPITAFFAFLGYTSTILSTAYRKEFYPKPMVPMENRVTEGVPFASLESLWPAFGRYMPPKSAEKWSRDHHENWKFAFRQT